VRQKTFWTGVGRDKFFDLLSDPKQLDRIYTDTNQEIIIHLEKFFRALARQFIFGAFSSNSKIFLFQIEAFSDIDDNQLGNTDYRQFEIYESIKRSKLGTIE